MTEKPSRASRSATAEPIPRDAPVTMATLPFCSLMAVSDVCQPCVGEGQNSYSIHGDNQPESGNIIRIIRTTGGRFGSRRRHASVYPGGRAAQLYLGRTGSGG